MIHYCRVVDGAVVDRAVFADPMPDDWPNRGDWRQSDEAQIGWTLDGETFVPPPAPPLPPLAEVKADARRRIIARADAFTAPLLSRYPEAERAGWGKREAEARAVLAAPDAGVAIAGTVIIKALAEAAGEDTAATLSRAGAIVAKADAFAAISADVEVMRDAALAAIGAVTDAADMPATLAALDDQAAALAAKHGL